VDFLHEFERNLQAADFVGAAGAGEAYDGWIAPSQGSGDKAFRGAGLFLNNGLAQSLKVPRLERQKGHSGFDSCNEQD
jgi:hypothetical protein